MKKITIKFYECEHTEDLNKYENDIRDSGGTIFISSVDSDEEIGTVLFEVENEDDFWTKFSKTDAYGFIN